VYSASAQFPSAETFGLQSQLRRASVSVASNIAEGAERPATREFLYFLGVAAGSVAEAETLTIIAKRLGYLSDDVEAQLLSDCDRIGKMLQKLKRALHNRIESC
jgi:four helix bundle protein